MTAESLKITLENYAKRLLEDEERKGIDRDTAIINLVQILMRKNGTTSNIPTLYIVNCLLSYLENEGGEDND